MMLKQMTAAARAKLIFTLGAAALASACPSEEPPEQNEDGCEGPWFEEYLGDTEALDGDFTCFDGALANPAPAAAAQQDIGLMGQSVDHQSSDLHPEVSVDIFFSDDHNASADLSFTTDGAGFAPSGLTVPACQPVSYFAERDANDAAPAPRTLVQHKVWDVEVDPISYDFRSVAQSTIDLITSPVFFGLAIEDGKGMLFGRAFDCDFESVVNAQVIVRDADCRIPTDALVGYTTNEFPDPNARATTDDGFFFGINIPAGDWTVEMYGQNDDGEFDLLGSAPITMEPDTVTLADLYLGRSDGLVIPTACR